ncbi:glycosyltransferase family 2 protein [uncultured Roseovarius sp.]|uniref:glycosyltransferase family 2 protein n=1 Tax=uncultured Roseovarius sp. TaxID=293344 RepID=UPI002633575D|nr:glycosyltransferase family 2 protein [uncultured Roseovarius sp.]
MGRAERINDLAQAYRLRWKRRRLLWRSYRKRRQLRALIDRTPQIKPHDILCFSTVRNEALRLPWFLEHHRQLGVRHFLIVDNASDDGTRDYLAAQPDVSLWTTTHSYKLSRFGVDWLTWLQMRHGHGHWCLTLDADECLIYPYHDTRPLPALCAWLDAQQCASFGALMLDMYPKGRLSESRYSAGQDPFAHLCWFDGGNYGMRRKADLQNLWIQGGPRARMFFASDPRRAPTMGKIPLVRWHWRYAYVSSAHSLLPRHLNHVYDRHGGELTSGVLLHSKFLDTVVNRSAEEKGRQEHFANSTLYDGYYDALTDDPDLWCETATRLTGWRQIEAMGLMSRGGWI